jgi:hypothetical protein
LLLGFASQLRKRKRRALTFALLLGCASQFRDYKHR